MHKAHGTEHGTWQAQNTCSFLWFLLPQWGNLKRLGKQPFPTLVISHQLRSYGGQNIIFSTNEKLWGYSQWCAGKCLTSGMGSPDLWWLLISVVQFLPPWQISSYQSDLTKLGVSEMRPLVSGELIWPPLPHTAGKQWSLVLALQFQPNFPGCRLLHL